VNKFKSFRIWKKNAAGGEILVLSIFTGIVIFGFQPVSCKLKTG